MINQYKSPKDKISTIINFCNILSAMILNTSKNKNNSANNTEKNNNTAGKIDQSGVLRTLCAKKKCQQHSPNSH